MNSKVAKRLRKKAIGFEDTKYEETAINGKKPWAITRIIKTDCRRKHYKDLKKNYVYS